MNRWLTFAVVVGAALVFAVTVQAAEKKAAPAQIKSEKVSSKAAPAEKAAPAKPIAKPSFNMLSGTISKIDRTDPAMVKIEIIDERDSLPHTIEAAPMTSVTKVTDLSELKDGDAIRVMARNTDGKDVAMGIMFGNIKRPAKIAAPAPVAKETPKKAAKETKKK